MPAPIGEFMQSLEHGLAVIRAFGTDRARMTLSEVAREAALSRASARRVLHTLVELGHAVTDGRVLVLAPPGARARYAYLPSQSLPELAQPHLEQLAEEVGESSSVAALDGADIVHVSPESRHTGSRRRPSRWHAVPGCGHIDVAHGAGPSASRRPRCLPGSRRAGAAHPAHDH